MAKCVPGADLLVYAEMIAALHRNYLSRLELMEVSGCVESTVTKFLRCFRTRNRQFIYVERWKINPRGPATAIYGWGWNRTDAAKPRAKTTAEHCRAYRIRKARASEMPLPRRTPACSQIGDQ